jgi:hypothetical protein
MLEMIDSNKSLAKNLFDMSQSASNMNNSNTTGRNSNNSVAGRRGKVEDYSWPFMCVSILLSREAIQFLRFGALNELVNKKKDALGAVHLFHHACFAQFGK